MRKKYFYVLVYLLLLCSCNGTNFSNPEDVIKNYRILSWEDKDEKLYNGFLSSKSKEFVTKDEFIKARYVPDSISKSTTLLERKIDSYPVDVNNPTYRRYKVDEKVIVKEDTVYRRMYYTLINENGNWKVIWTGALFSFAERKYSDGNYLEARKTLEKIIEINPFNGDSYGLLTWCYYRDYSLTNSDRDNGIVKNAKYAITLEEDNPTHYNTLAAYYSSIGNSDLVIESCERGLSYCRNKSEKQLFYSNLVGSYGSKRDFKKAEDYIKKAVEINPKDAFAWYKYGTLMQMQGKIDKALEYFEKALKGKKMENYLQGSLFYSYAVCCLDKGNCEAAKEYINKALDIEPNDEDYQALYNKIKYCN